MILTGLGYLRGRPRGLLMGVVVSVLVGVEPSSPASACLAEPLLSTPISSPASFWTWAHILITVSYCKSSQKYTNHWLTLTSLASYGPLPSQFRWTVSSATDNEWHQGVTSTDQSYWRQPSTKLRSADHNAFTWLTDLAMKSLTQK